MSTVNATIKVTDAAGAVSAPANVVITIVDPPAIGTVTVSPQSAPTGTTRTITIAASDPNSPSELPLTCSVVRSDGGAVTQTSAAGTLPFVFTAVV